MNNKYGKIILSFMLSVPYFAFSQTPEVTDVRSLNIGVILPLTGDAASIGNAVKNGIELGYEDLSPVARKHLQIHFEDDSLQPKNSMSALNRLLSDDKIDFLINAGSNTGNALAPVAEAKHLPFISIATDPKVSQGKKYVFNFWVSAKAENDAVIPEIKKSGYKRIARISAAHDMMTAVIKDFDSRKDSAVDVVLSEEFTPDIKDFRSFLTKTRVQKPDAIMVLLLPGQVGVFAKQARELGVDVPLFGYELFEDRGEVDASSGALIHQRYVNAADSDQVFSARYEKKYRGTSLGAANGHDALLLISSALEQGISPENFPTYLRNLKDFHGALGTYSASGNNSFSLPAVIKVVTENGFEVVPQR